MEALSDLVKGTKSAFDAPASAVSGTTATTTTSATPVLISGLTLTPAAGQWVALFHTTASMSNPSAVVSASLFIGGVEQADTIKTLKLSAGNFGPLVFNKLFTANGTDAVEVRWSTTTGTATAYARNLTLIRVA